MSVEFGACFDEFFEEQKKALENRPHIPLPESCVIPTDLQLTLAD